MSPQTRAVENWTLQPLTDFVRESSVRLVLVLTPAGQVLAQSGFSRAVDVMSAAALAASSPTTSTGRRAPHRSSAAAWIPAGSGSGARKSRPGANGAMSVSCSSTSIGSATKTGPAGGSVAILSAR